MNEIQQAVVAISEEKIDAAVCPDCEGTGIYDPPYEEGTAIMDVLLICQKCEGKGKIKGKIK